MPPGRQPFTAMTFNVRSDDEWDGEHRWAFRRDAVIDTIRTHAPDLLALQEPTDEQSADIAAALDGMRAIGGGFVRRERFEVGDSGAFEISARGSRTCAWTRLRDRAAGRPLVFACTHVDTAENAWQPSAQRLHAELDAVAGETPIVLAGDFNCAAGCAAHRYLLDAAGYRDAWYGAGCSDDGVMTYNGFTPYEHLPEGEELQRWLDLTSPSSGEFAHYQAHVRRHGNYRIDWILMRGSLRCTSAVIDSRRSDRLLPSDHYAVAATLDWM